VKALKRAFGIGDAARSMPERACLCCGRCCDLFGGHLNASKADLERWRTLGREDLLRRVSSIGWIWMSPETGRLEPACPFLERVGPDQARCTIHPIKPDICRSYPTLAHGRRCLRGVFLAAPAWLADVAPALSVAG
jgi:Fe-S-cluster containining protein